MVVALNEASWQEKTQLHYGVKFYSIKSIYRCSHFYKRREFTDDIDHSGKMHEHICIIRSLNEESNSFFRPRVFG